MIDIIKKSMPAELRDLAAIIKDAGYSLYLVGGFVRDIFIGSCDAYENDIDVCGDCPPEIFSEIISGQKNIKLCEANYPLGTLKLIIDKLDIEYTCFRKESYRGDGYHTPSEIIFTKDMLQDAKRRDFTINALYLDPLTYEITDYFDGQKHISDKVIKTVRQSKEVFTEDALRILRMCRFSAKLGFNIESSTLLGAEHCVHLLKNISNERIGSELDRILWDTEYLEFGIEAIYKASINKIICGDVKKETALKVCDATPNREVRWAIFLSDYSPENTQAYLINLSLGKSFANDIAKLIENRNLYQLEDNEIVLHFAKIGEYSAGTQIDFISAFSKNGSSRLKSIFNNMKSNNQFLTYEMLNINGNEIMQILNIKGPSVKIYKDKAYEYAVLNPTKNNYDDLRKFLLSAK